MSLKILVASDHSLVREGLVRLLNAEADLAAEGRCLNDESLKTNGAADVVLSVVGSRPDVGVVIGDLMSRYPDARTLCLLLVDDDAVALSALRSGVIGVVVQTVGATELIDSIKQLAAGEFIISNELARRLARLHGTTQVVARPAGTESELTQREVEVLRLLAEGDTNRDIAARLSLSEHTVRAHMRGIMQKLNVSNRVQAAALAWQGQLLGKKS